MACEYCVCVCVCVCMSVKMVVYDSVGQLSHIVMSKKKKKKPVRENNKNTQNSTWVECVNEQLTFVVSVQRLL